MGNKLNYSFDTSSIVNTTINNTTLSVLSLIISFITLVLSLILIISMWKTLEKKGEKGWKSLIPIYNMIVLCKISNTNPYLILLSLIPFVGILIFCIILYVNLAKSFNKSGGYVVGLLFLPIIFFPILAFSDYKEKENNENISTNKNNVEEEIKEVENIVINNDVSQTENIPEIENNVAKENQVQETINNVEKNISNDVSAFNVNPITNNEVTLPENIEKLENTSNDVSAFNITPNINNEVIQTENIEQLNNIPVIENNVINEIPEKEITNNLEETIININNISKKCKNCECELPELVTICPKCGMENE